MFKLPFLRPTPDLSDQIQTVRNEGLSFFNFNSQRIDQLRIDLWEGNQNLLDRFYSSNANSAFKPVKVLFMIPDTSLWDVYSAVFSRMRACDQFAVEVLAFRRADVLPDKSEHEVREFFAQRKIPVRLEGFKPGQACKPIKSNEADLIFYTLGSAAYPSAYKIEFTSLFCRTCYLPYGVLLANQEEYQFNQDFHHSAWAVFASTEREKALYEKHAKRKSINIVLTGYPKFDVLRERPRSKPDRPIIIWAPHWTIGLVYPQLNYGLFDKHCMDMVELIRSFPVCDFVFKPHPNLAHALKQTTFMDDEAYALYLTLLEQLPNCRIWKHGDYADLFHDSSMMITDSISFLAEYLVTGHPLLFLERQDRTRLNDLGEELIKLHYSGSTIDDIKGFIDQQLTDQNDLRRADRLSRGKQLLEIGEIPASKKIVKHIMNCFGIDTHN